MPTTNRVVGPGPNPRSVRTESGEVLRVPSDWALLPPGDAGLTRRVKKAGPTWTVKEKKGRRMFSKGVWALEAHILDAKRDLDVERADPAYTRRLEAGRSRRAKEQVVYAEDFEKGVRSFLGFDATHATLGAELARAIAAHAVPVGSGTVARTKRISLERRAEAATIAWLRHATTAYDTMSIARIKGERREVRRQLAQRSRQLLDRYRRGERIDQDECLLRRGLRAARTA